MARIVKGTCKALAVKSGRAGVNFNLVCQAMGMVLLLAFASAWALTRKATICAVWRQTIQPCSTRWTGTQMAM